MARILLIDDDEAFRAMLRATLEHFGHTVREAPEGRAGLERLARDGADLVITDIVMPGMEGLEVLMTVRKMRPPVAIIAMSGGGRGSATDYLHLAQLMGAAKVLAKPFSNEALIAAIAEVTGNGTTATG